MPEEDSKFHSNGGDIVMQFVPRIFLQFFTILQAKWWRRLNKCAVVKLNTRRCKSKRISFEILAQILIKSKASCLIFANNGRSQLKESYRVWYSFLDDNNNLQHDSDLDVECTRNLQHIKCVNIFPERNFLQLLRIVYNLTAATSLV